MYSTVVSTIMPDDSLDRNTDFTASDDIENSHNSRSSVAREEVVLENILWRDVDELKRKLLASCRRVHSGVIIAYTADAFRDRFVFGNGNQHKNRIAIHELILFRQSKKNTRLRKALLAKIKTKTNVAGRSVTLPSTVILKDDPIICRIIGTDLRKTVRVSRIYWRFHGKPDRFSTISNMTE